MVTFISRCSADVVCSNFTLATIQSSALLCLLIQTRSRSNGGSNGGSNGDLHSDLPSCIAHALSPSLPLSSNLHWSGGRESL